jgi:hypothetical protein
MTDSTVTLEALYLRHTRVADAGIRFLIEIEHLRAVDLRGTAVTATGREWSGDGRHT